MGLRFSPIYTPLYPPAPLDGDTWTDPNTGIVWEYDQVTGWYIPPVPL